MNKTIPISANIQDKNNSIASKTRELCARLGIRVVNMISSPGSGKTSLLVAMAKQLGQRLAVITGDIQTTIDADRIAAGGARAIQIETGGSCHLTADMVHSALLELDLSGVELLVIENIGNLVCPSTLDLGEQLKIALLSVAEGDEKPIKYPALFVRAAAVVFTKIDLAPYVNFDFDRATRDIRSLNSSVKIFSVSTTQNIGTDSFTDYCLTLQP